jgi:hypothetical protein
LTDPSLKCVVVHSPRRHLCSLVADALVDRVPQGELWQFGEDACVLNTPAPAAEVRDWLRGVLEADERALVFEFETWSGLGPVDAAWLMRRGH